MKYLIFGFAALALLACESKEEKIAKAVEKHDKMTNEYAKKEGKKITKMLEVSKKKQAGENCKKYGEGKHGITCTDKQCRESVVCKGEGRCASKSGVCQPATDADCRPSNLCKWIGWCVKTPSPIPDDPADCRIGSDADCLQSLYCKHDGRCKKKDAISCVVESPDVCAKIRPSGKSKIVDGKCSVESTADCKSSAACKTEGRCSYKDGKCIK